MSLLGLIEYFSFHYLTFFFKPIAKNWVVQSPSPEYEGNMLQVDCFNNYLKNNN